MPPKTLLELAGAPATTPHLNDSVLIVIDAQREYVDGKLPLSGIDPALKEISALLARARKAKVPVIHVQHRGRAGGAFGPDTPGFAITDGAAPAGTEAVIEKGLPNAFAGTTLGAALEGLGRKQLILTGFMTHMCVEATARAALDHGFKTSVVAAATATRDLPDPLTGETVSAAEVQRNALAALADRFATVVANGAEIVD
ncbi:MAG: cysteine hydrolase family protein [Pseudolabrys sp.]